MLVSWNSGTVAVETRVRCSQISKHFKIHTRFKHYKLCMVTPIARVRISRVRLPILLVVS